MVYEIGIIGGGPAGSALAAYLAKKDFKVILIEKKIFPREVLCGEFLSSEVSFHLKELNIFEKFLSLNPNKINCFSFYNDDGSLISSKLPFQAYALKRSMFDELLISCAKDAGAVIKQPMEVKKIDVINDGFILSSSDEEIQVKKLAAAWGKQNVLDKLSNRNFIDKPSKLNGIKFHIPKSFVKNNENEISIFAGNGIYCGVNSISNYEATFCFLEDRNEIKIPPREQLLRLKKENTFFSDIINELPEEQLFNLEIYGTGNIHFGKKGIVKNGIYFVGDSAEIIAPLAGDGIGMALQSASILSQCFVEQREGKLSSNQTEKLYLSNWKKAFSRRLLTAQLVQRSILNNSIRRSSVKVLNVFPFLIETLIKNTRSV